MAYDAPADEYGKPLGAPPNAEWDAETGQWKTKKPTDPGFDKTFGGYTTGDPHGESEGDQWLDSVYDAQGWPKPPKPAAAPTPDAPTPKVPTPDAPTPDAPKPPLQTAYSGYLQQPTNPYAEQTNGLIQQLIAQQSMDRTRQESERAAMREILMGRIGKASEPLDRNAPGIREMLASQRLTSQRSAERQRSQLAARMSAEGLGDSGALDTGISAIEQGRGESEAAGEAQILGGELQAKRDELRYLLQLAVQSGDAESARNLQTQLAAIDAQFQQQSFAEGGRRFDQDLGFRKSSFVDDLGMRLLQLQLMGNQNAFNAFM